MAKNPKEQQIPVDRALEARLSKDFNVHLVYPWYDGWHYDNPVADDPFIRTVVSDLTAYPKVTALAKRLNASIYLCEHQRKTHHKRSFLDAMGRVDSTPALCDPHHGEITLGRLYFDREKNGYRQTANPAFIIAHELGHIIDAKLGKCLDPWGEDLPTPATLADNYAKRWFNKDRQSKGFERFMARVGLGGDEGGGWRHDHTEIICDLIAHQLTDNQNVEAAALAQRHRRLEKLAAFMIEAAQSNEGINAYRAAADFSLGKDLKSPRKPLAVVRRALRTAAPLP